MAMRGTSRFAATESLAYADADRTGVIHGRLGRKDLYGWRADNVPDRLTPPLVRENGRLAEADWDGAMDRVARCRRELLHDQGPGALSFCTAGQLFLEEYYTLAAISHGAIGPTTRRREHALADTQSVTRSRVLDRPAGPNLPRVIDGDLLGQAAQSARDADLLTLRPALPPGDPAPMRWADAMRKVFAPQILAGP